jgi:hypothetical protein
MLKAFSFVGAGRYEAVTYVWEERSHTTRLFPEALARVFEPEKVIVFVTERAKNSRASESEPRYVEMLQDKLGDRVAETPRTALLGTGGSQTHPAAGFRRNSGHWLTWHPLSSCLVPAWPSTSAPSIRTLHG